jgi:hypothetical protein
LSLFCVATLFFLIFRDLFVPDARDTEVWFGFELHGALAWATAPLHWAIFGAGAWGFWRGRPWISPWASVYAFYIAASHLIWNLVSPSGGGLGDGVVQLVLFSIPALALLVFPARSGKKHSRRLA